MVINYSYYDNHFTIYVNKSSYCISYTMMWSFPVGTGDKESACQCKRCRSDPLVGKIPWKRAWQPTLVSLSGESYVQRSLASYSP